MQNIMADRDIYIKLPSLCNGWEGIWALTREKIEKLFENCNKQLFNNVRCEKVRILNFILTWWGRFECKHQIIIILKGFQGQKLCEYSLQNGGELTSHELINSIIPTRSYFTKLISKLINKLVVKLPSIALLNFREISRMNFN